jgi:hypothetical protein
MMKTIEFKNPEFRRGLQVTVRRGRKWLDLIVGEVVKLVDTAGKIKPRTAEVVGVMCCRFHDIPQGTLDLEHDPQCVDRYVLLDEMRRCYEGFEPWEVVTVVFFMVTGIA